MPPRDSHDVVSLPLLDRLTDLELSLAADPPLTRAESVRRLRASLRRDLEWLFNTRANHELTPDYPEVFRSVMNFGLPDFTNFSMSTLRDRQRLQRQIEVAISHFEPRLGSVQVRLIGDPTDGGKSVRFQIDGLLKMDPAPEHISFDTILDVPTGDYQVKGDAGAR